MRVFSEAEKALAVQCGCAVIQGQPKREVIETMIIGSVFINGRGKDIDVLFLIKYEPGNSKQLGSLILPDPWKFGGSAKDSDSWQAWRTDAYGMDINLIITDRKEIFETWRVSSQVCRYLTFRQGPLKKATRVAIHRIVQEGAVWDKADLDIDQEAP